MHYQFYLLMIYAGLNLFIGSLSSILKISLSNFRVINLIFGKIRENS